MNPLKVVTIYKILLLIIFVGLMACTRVVIPEKPSAVPEDAIWAGGVDGGSWFQCERKGEFRYFCKIYDDNQGYVWAYGEFLYRKVRYDREAKKLIITKPSAPLSELRFVFFNGYMIELEGYGNALVPDGVIIYPETYGSGVMGKAIYKEGVLISEEKIELK